MAAGGRGNAGVRWCVGSGLNEAKPINVDDGFRKRSTHPTRYMAPWGYAQLQVMAQAIEGTKSIDDRKLADYIRASTFKTVLGDVKFGKDGEWAQPRMLQVQFHDVKSNDAEQFRAMNTQTVVTPAEYKSGNVIYPYEKAK